MELGGSIGYYESRDEEDSSKLTGFGDIDDGFDGRIFAKLKMDRISLFFQIQNDLSGSHDGALVNIGAGYSYHPFRSSTWTFKTSTTFADSNYMQTYFSVSQAQINASSLSSGVPFTATGGWKDIGFSSNFSIKLGRKLNAKWLMGYKRLTRAAAYSPLVRGLGSADQYYFGIGLTYSFSRKAFRF